MRGFPRGNPHLLVPVAPRKAALAGLSLYDAAAPRQRRVLRLGRAAARGGLLRFVTGAVERSGSPAPEWWHAWLRDVAEPVVGHVRFCPRATGSARFRALLLAADGTPRGFGKVVPVGSSQGLAREAAVHRVLVQASPRRFRTPRLLRHGDLDGWAYLLFEALPDVMHRPLPADPQLVAGVVDELQRCLAELPKDAAAPAGHVPGHGDFTARNARVAADGRVWVIDWEEASWMPRLADELRFWAAHFGAGRRPGRVRRHAPRAVRILQSRGSARDILEAVAWPEYNTPGEQALRDMIGALVSGRDG